MKMRPVFGFCLLLASTFVAAQQCPAVPTNGSQSAKVDALVKSVNCLVDQKPPEDPDKLFVDRFEVKGGPNASPNSIDKTYGHIVAAIVELGAPGSQNAAVATPMQPSGPATASVHGIFSSFCEVDISDEQHAKFSSIAGGCTATVIYKK